MPIRVYCPDCNAPRSAPDGRARVRCRACGRVFRAGARNERGDRSRSRDREPAGQNRFMYVLVGAALMTVVLVMGCGLAGWYALTRDADELDRDEQVVEPEEDERGHEQPPPVIADQPEGGVP